VLRERPDECLIATSLPGGGIRAAAEIHARAPEVAIVMVGTVPDDAELFAALEAGARGSLLRDIAPTALGNALRGIMRGEAAIPPPPSSPGSSQSSALAARRAAVARSAARSTV
jgi:two-component system nitrate/nitrite response regulator NarL